MTDTAAPRRTTGALFVLGAVSFGVAASVLSATFAWPDILREPADVVLPAFLDGGKINFRADAYGWDERVAVALGMAERAGRRFRSTIRDIGP